MLLDDKGFVPGHKTKRTYRVAFDPSDLDKPYHDGRGCPLYMAMTRAGVPVEVVGPTCLLVGGNAVEFSPDLKRISARLSNSEFWFLALGVRRRYARWSLWGREFEVTV